MILLFFNLITNKILLLVLVKIERKELRLCYIERWGKQVCEFPSLVLAV